MGMFGMSYAFDLSLRLGRNHCNMTSYIATLSPNNTTKTFQCSSIIKQPLGPLLQAGPVAIFSEMFEVIIVNWR